MQQFIQISPWVVMVLALWVLPWKGYALWTASRNRSKVWFLVLLVLNTFAILDIFYIFYIAKKKPSDILKLFKTKL